MRILVAEKDSFVRRYLMRWSAIAARSPKRGEFSRFFHEIDRAFLCVDHQARWCVQYLWSMDVQQLEHPYRTASVCTEALVAEHVLVDFYHTIRVPAIKGPEAIFEHLVQPQPFSGHGEQVCFQLAWITGPL